VLDVAVRIGIADDRFTAWVAAWRGTANGGEEAPVVAIPRGGSAAFLAPQPLSLLNISPEVQQMLVMLGVRTLGAFADLPAPSVARRWDCDLQALARGEGGAELYSVKPGTGPLREEVAVSDELGVGAAVALLAERVALRLIGRGGVAAAMEVTTHAEGGAESVTLWLVPPLHQAEELADLCRSRWPSRR
jgi:protein ImuB